MSDSTNDTNTTPNTNDAPAKAKRTRKVRESFTVSDLARMRAKQRGIDESRAAKEVRGRLRANFAHVCKLDPSIARVKERANDGNRWPVLNRKVAEFILKSKQAQARES